MTFDELKQVENPILTFTSEDVAKTANDLISYHMGFDMKTTVRWAEPQQQEDGTWFISDPVAQCGTEEQYTAVMERVMDYENAVQALLDEVGV